MKGLRVNCKTGTIERVDDGLPFPEYPTPKVPPKIDLTDLERLIEYAKKEGWI